MPDAMDFEFNMGGDNKPRRVETSPFVMLVLGDFGGSICKEPDSAPGSLIQAPVRQVDIDNIDKLWSVFAPRLEIEIEESLVRFEPRDLDDFHPDHLFRSQALFRELRKLRERLLNPASSAEALAEVMGSAAKQTAEDFDPATDSRQGASENGDQMFERLLGEHPAQRPVDGQSHLDKLLQKIVAPYVVYDLDSKVEAAVDAVDLAIAGTMRSILHHADFQALEAAWRSLVDLVYELEIGEALILKVCNVSKKALLAGLPSSAESLPDCGLYQLLAGRLGRAANDDFSLLLCNYSFGGTVDDVALLATLSALAEMHDAAVIGAAKSELLGTQSLVQQPTASEWSQVDNPFWRQLRESPLARRIGLLLPRILGRLPYGKTTEEIDDFEFDEIESIEHEKFLWVNPVLACGKLLASGFTRYGWAMSPDSHTDLNGLPVYNYLENDEQKMLPCAELLLPERSAEAILALGIMPIVSFRNRDMARLMRFQSIAEPLAALSGPWRVDA